MQPTLFSCYTQNFSRNDTNSNDKFIWKTLKSPKNLTALKTLYILPYLLFSCSVVLDSFTTPPSYSVHGIFWARLLEWVAIFSSRGSSWTRDQTHYLLHCRWILYCWATRGAFCTSTFLILSLLYPLLPMFPSFFLPWSLCVPIIEMLFFCLFYPSILSGCTLTNVIITSLWIGPTSASLASFAIFLNSYPAFPLVCGIFLPEYPVQLKISAYPKCNPSPTHSTISFASTSRKGDALWVSHESHLKYWANLKHTVGKLLHTRQHSWPSSMTLGPHRLGGKKTVVSLVQYSRERVSRVTKWLAYS